MSEPSIRRQGMGVLGIGTAACLACCAGPILAFLGGLTLAGLASTVLIGATGLVIALSASAAWMVLRRRRAAPSCTPTGPVTVAAPTRTSAP